MPAGLPPGAGIPLIMPQEQIKTAGSTSRDRFSPEVFRAQEELTRIRQQREGMERRQGEILQNVAKIESDARLQEMATNVQVQEEKSALREETAADIQVAKDAYEDDVQTYEGMEMTDYMSSRSDSQKAMISWGIALGELGAAIGGGQNPALAMFNKAVDRDFRRQKEKILKAKDEVNMALTGIKNAEQAQERRLADLQAKKEAMRLGRIAEAEAKKIAATSQQAKLTADMAIQDQQEKIAQETAEFAQKVGKSTVRRNIFKRFAPTAPAPGGVAPPLSELTGKVPTAPERKADGFAMRMTDQYKVIRDAGGMSEEGADTLRQIAQFERIAGSGFAGGIREALPKALGGGTIEQRLSPQDRAVFNALQEFGAANLRLESGAAIAASEMVSQMERISRVPGDTEADVRAKERSAENQIMSVAGQSYRPSHWRSQVRGRAQPQAPAAPTAPTPITPRAPRGQRPAPLQPPRAGAELQGAINWLRKHPNDKDAKAVRARIRQLRGK